MEIGKSDQLYIEELVLNPIKLRVSISGSLGHEKEERALGSLLSDVGLSFTSVDASSISLKGYYVTNIYESKNVLISRLLKHYKTQAILELYKMLGSFEILGNPAKFIDSLGVGMKQMFQEPVEALMHSPKQFATKLVKGPVGMARSTFNAVFYSFGKFTGSLGQGLAALSFDDEFVRTRRKFQAQKVENIGQGLK